MVTMAAMRVFAPEFLFLGSLTSALGLQLGLESGAASLARTCNLLFDQYQDAKNAIDSTLQAPGETACYYFGVYLKDKLEGDGEMARDVDLVASLVPPLQQKVQAFLENGRANDLSNQVRAFLKTKREDAAKLVSKFSGLRHAFWTRERYEATCIGPGLPGGAGDRGHAIARTLFGQIMPPVQALLDRSRAVRDSFKELEHQLRLARRREHLMQEVMSVGRPDDGRTPATEDGDSDTADSEDLQQEQEDEEERRELFWRDNDEELSAASARRLESIMRKKREREEARADRLALKIEYQQQVFNMLFVRDKFQLRLEKFVDRMLSDAVRAREEELDQARKEAGSSSQSRSEETQPPAAFGVLPLTRTTYLVAVQSGHHVPSQRERNLVTLFIQSGNEGEYGQASALLERAVREKMHLLVNVGETWAGMGVGIKDSPFTLLRISQLEVFNQQEFHRFRQTVLRGDGCDTPVTVPQRDPEPSRGGIPNPHGLFASLGSWLRSACGKGRQLAVPAQSEAVPLEPESVNQNPGRERPSAAQALLQDPQITPGQFWLRFSGVQKAIQQYVFVDSRFRTTCPECRESLEKSSHRKTPPTTERGGIASSRSSSSFGITAHRDQRPGRKQMNGGSGKTVGNGACTACAAAKERALRTQLGADGLMGLDGDMMPTAAEALDAYGWASEQKAFYASQWDWLVKKSHRSTSSNSAASAEGTSVAFSLTRDAPKVAFSVPSNAALMIDMGALEVGDIAMQREWDRKIDEVTKRMENLALGNRAARRGMKQAVTSGESEQTGPILRNSNAGSILAEGSLQAEKRSLWRGFVLMPPKGPDRSNQNTEFAPLRRAVREGARRRDHVVTQPLRDVAVRSGREADARTRLQAAVSLDISPFNAEPESGVVELSAAVVDGFAFCVPSASILGSDAAPEDNEVSRRPVQERLGAFVDELLESVDRRRPEMNLELRQCRNDIIMFDKGLDSKVHEILEVERIA